jgi:hypothetical protein
MTRRANPFRYFNSSPDYKEREAAALATWRAVMA